MWGTRGTRVFSSATVPGYIMIYYISHSIISIPYNLQYQMIARSLSYVMILGENSTT